MMLELGPREISKVRESGTWRDGGLEVHDFLALGLSLQLLLAGQPHQQILRIRFAIQIQLLQKLQLKIKQSLDLQIESIAPRTHGLFLVESMGVGQRIGATEPFIVFSEVQEIAIHFDDHLAG